MKIQYCVHLILNSKFRVYINLFIILCIYIILDDSKILYCMAEDNNTFTIVEANENLQPSHQVLALTNEIKSYAGSQANLLKQIQELNLLIERQNMLLEDKDNTINYLLHDRIPTLIEQNQELENEIANLRPSLSIRLSDFDNDNISNEDNS